MFRKPESDDEEDYGTSRLVKAKPISEKHMKKLGSAYGQGKDFVVGSSRSQAEFYGEQEVRREEEVEEQRGAKPLTEDERNKIAAKILKAELKGDKDLVRKLKRKLESGVSEEKEDKTVMMLKRTREGNILPANKKSSDLDRHAPSSSRMQREYGKQQELSEMLREEKHTTAEDQLRLFENSLVKSSKIRRHDDESIDDIAEMQKGRRKADEKKERKDENKLKKEHRRLERSLEDCVRCIDSPKLDKVCIVAVGINTYLAIVEWDGLDEQHCIIAPTGHYSSSIQLDENVWDEMRIWRKGLVAMWKEQGRDCVFMEMARDVQLGPHCLVECIPLPDEIGETAPIYFKKAINECEGEYVDNKKLIETKDLRRQIPKGFSYFAIDFGLQNGFAHVIEDAGKFPTTFGHEILVGMMDLPANKWRKKERMELAKLRDKCDAFKRDWEPFDWTKKIQRDK